MASISTFFDEIIKMLEECERQYGISSSNFVDYVLQRLEFAINTCVSLHNTLSSHDDTPPLEDFCSCLYDLVECLLRYLQKWKEYEEIMDSYSYTSFAYRTPLLSNGNYALGRPRFDISREQLLFLESMSFNWTEVGALLGVSRMTVYRRRVEYGLMDSPHEISDADLTDICQDIRREAPFSGVQMVCGTLRSRGIKVSRDRVRQVLRSIDPLAAATRWPPSIIRRKPYSVPGPNSLWHIDSHHKLIRWRFVSHGCIDGYSRLIVYLHCSSNNRSTTVYDLFLKAVFTYSLPSRVRSDHGMENILVARHMIEKRGADRCSMITGSSTHNQRIERLWRDMHQSCTILYYKLFYFMEEIGILNPLNEYHLWALHYVYLARINRSLTQFISSWNNHCIRTANHKTPYQLYTSGILLLQNSNIDALDFYDNKDDTYGIDSDGPIPVSDNLVEVPQTTLRFSEDDIMYLKQTVNPCAPSDEYGIDLYEQTLQIIMDFNRIS